MNYSLFIASVTFTICAASVAHASDDWREIQVGDGSLLYSDKDVAIRGKWKAGGDYKFPRIAKVNSSYIYCNHASMTCLESRAQVEQLRGRDIASSPYMTSYTVEYEVQQWSKQTIVAKLVNPRGIPINSVLEINQTAGNVRMEWKDQPDGNGYFLPSEQQFEIVIKDHYPFN